MKLKLRNGISLCAKGLATPVARILAGRKSAPPRRRPRKTPNESATPTPHPERWSPDEKDFAQRIALMNAMYRLPAHKRPTLPDNTAERLLK